MSSVSFIIPVYNKQKYLKYVIDSLRNQTGNFEREFIFVNDGSTDKSLSVLKSETKDLKNCYIFNQENKGSANATNFGIKKAKHQFIKFLDADDVIINSATETLLNIIQKNKKCNLVYGLQRKVEDLSNLKLDIKVNSNKYLIIKDPIKLAMRNSMFNPSQFLVNTKICKQSGGCDERIKFSQEYSLTLRLSLYGGFYKLNEYIAILPENAPGQISEKKINQIYRVSKALELFLKDNHSLDKKYKRFAIRRLTGRAYRFSRREANCSFFSKWLKFYIIGLTGLTVDHLKLCENVNKIYEKFLIK
ncbi:MAG: hypothetical protein CMM91_06210 [Rickettsiales bacterium]|nr:hypothetical protein [Rickettsiales bacterium]OUV53394.1 MAG: hypothetical protein CBC87_04190 [Rickettsiales bacterium TMED127]|tara:strand:+ start:44230 stop:45141 length:912 start_codon:yes stop_codon:yes gene_type:complete